MHMKKILLFVVIFALGAFSYSLLNPWLSSLLKKGPEVKTNDSITITNITNKESTSTANTPQVAPKPQEKKEMVITEDGSQLDGPFSFVDSKGQVVPGTAQIVRSPEETLLQFKAFTGKYSPDSHIYFSNDLKATSFLNLGIAHMADGSQIYGIPAEGDLSKYHYILIYDAETGKVEYSAKIE